MCLLCMHIDNYNNKNNVLFILAYGKGQIEAAMQEISEKSCIKFVKKTVERNWIKFTKKNS